MGMAASQARYLALVARKSNCEYEGQQINQARLNLSNQSANLFNQMLGLTVPVPPSTQDYTTTQYSYTDGINSSVIDSWKQLSEADPDYNYIVKTHYYTDVYTGSIKKMTDPQVQISNPTAPIASLAQIQNAYTTMMTAQEEMESKYNNWQAVKRTQEAKIAKIMSDAQEALASGEITSDITTAYDNIPGMVYRFSTSGTNSYQIYQATNAAGSATDPNGEKILKQLHDLVDLGVISIDAINAKIMQHLPSLPLLNDISDLEYDTVLTDKQAGVLQTYVLCDEVDNTYTGTGNLFIATIDDAKDVFDAVSGGAIGSLSGYQIEETGSTDPLTKSYLDDIEDCRDIIDAAAKAYYDDSTDPPTGAKVNYDKAKAAYDALGRPSYIGNCELTYLNTLTDDQNTELQQVVKDMIAQGVDTDIINCFDTAGNYLGGVYSFQLNGVTYYTTYQNLVDAYASNHVSNNFIDAQYKMPYYNALYVNTRIDQEGKALLETDGQGRFTTVRFENDSVTYTLNMETITDDAAYNDAMNRYYYENAQYDKMVQDINAKTSIIHQQDQELELRLKQLDTEQNALKTEIDAVQKIVKDNVDASFKTFGG